MNKNMINVDGFNAIVTFDSDSNMLHGEFIGLNGGADFFATNTDDLHKEAKISLSTFLDVCKEQGIEPVKNYSGKFNTRIEPKLHEKLFIAATSQGKSINEVVNEAIEREVERV